MKKSNVILQAAIASALLAMAGSASAGNLSTAVAGGTIFAAEDFGTTTTAATAIVPGTVTYSVATTNGVVLNAGGKIYLTIRLANGKFAAAPAASTITGTALAVGGVGNGAVGTGVLSSDSTTVMYPITFKAAATLGAGASLTYTPAATNIVGVNAALATAGTVVNATESLSVITPVIISPSTTTSPNTGTAQAADIDGAAVTAPIALSSLAITSVVNSLAGANIAAGGKVQIDLTATPVSSRYISTIANGTQTAVNQVALGSVQFTDATTVANQLDGATAYNTAAAVAGASVRTITVTPGAGQSFPVGAQVFVDVTSAACGKPLAGTGISAVLTATTAAAAVTLTVPAATAGASAASYFVCMNAPSATNVATPVTPSITASLTSAITTSKATSVSGTGYALGYNGSQTDVRNYVPLAVAGWTQYLRVINTGSVTASVSAQAISDTTGLPIGSAAVVISNMPAGAATTLSSTQIEAAIGAQAVASRPRIRITAPTNGMDVQNFVFTPNGSFTAAQGTDK